MGRCGAEVKVAKNQRQHRIVRLLESSVVSSQTHLLELLAAEGFLATQATVSRDLEELGAVKVRLGGGEVAYAIPELPFEQALPEDHLRRVLSEWVVESARSGDLVVLRTPPGSAHVVASALDRSNLEGAIGTVAGDDTLLVVAVEGGGAALGRRLGELAGLAGEGDGTEDGALGGNGTQGGTGGLGGTGGGGGAAEGAGGGPRRGAGEVRGSSDENGTEGRRGGDGRDGGDGAGGVADPPGRERG